MRELNIVPKPKAIRFTAGDYQLPHKVKVRISDKASYELKALGKVLAEYGAEIVSLDKVDCDFYYLGIGHSEKILLAPGKKPNGKEGYVLSITEKGIEIAANATAGLFWGIQTLAQMLEDSKRLPAVRIDDYPDIEMRGMHLDFKGTFSNKKHLWQIVEKLAYYKINTVLVEYEDKIAYGKKRKFVSPYALSRSEVEKFVSHCRAHHIEVIPLLQSLGHVEYILKHPAYESLREGGRYDQFCPSNPESLKLFAECARELVELHPDTEWFHLGGDETCALGVCPKCKEKADKSGATALYIEYITKAVQIIRKLGKQPIIWDDMLTRSGHPELLDKLPRGITLMYWQYMVTEQETSAVQVKGIIASRQWLTKGVDRQIWQQAPDLFGHLLEDGLPSDRQRPYDLYKKYIHTRNSPLFFNSLPFLKLLKEKKIPVIGASACRTSNDQRIINIPQRLGNIVLWAKTAKKNRLRGVICTSWARADSLGAPNVLTEDIWYPMVAAGEFQWNSAADRKDFDKRFNFRFLGLEDTRFTDLQYTLFESRSMEYYSMTGAIVKEFKNLLTEAKRNRRYLEHIYYLARIESFVRYLRLFWFNHEAGSFTRLNPVAKIPLPANIPGSIFWIKKEIKERRRQLPDLRREGISLYRQTILEREARERVETLVRPIEAFYECALREIERAAK